MPNPASTGTVHGPSARDLGLDPDEVTTAMRLQILSTEHWSLLASRSLAWNESFARVGTFLSTLSFAVVALALVGQATGFEASFRAFGLVVLPVVLFLGIATALRLDSANHHDALCVVGMNRIRAAYLRMAPELAPLFVMGVTDDRPGVTLTMATAPDRSLAANFVSAAPVLVMVLNSMLAASIGALVGLQVGLDTGPAIAIAAGIFVIAAAIQLTLARRLLTRVIRSHQPLFADEPAGSEPRGDAADG